jgi:ubiquinone/menaquinone biosynthesis C-methylase UbiE
MPGPERESVTNLPPDEYKGAIAARYATGQTPWDTGVPCPEVLRCVADGDLPGGTLLEVGCGTGTHAIALARAGFRVTAVDLVESAIRRAREKARQANVAVDFRQGDLTQLDLGGPYDCLLDVGVYHGIRNRDLKGFVSTLARVSRHGTRWLSLAGSASDPCQEGPPPKVSEADLRRELEPTFRILRAREFRYELRPDFQPLFWSILLEYP